MPDRKILARTIQKYFDGNLESLSWEKQLHYCERLFRLTGEAQYENRIRRLVPKQLAEAVRLKTLMEGDWSAETQKLLSQFTILKPADELKLGIYQHNPLLLIIFKFLWYVYDSWLWLPIDPPSLDTFQLQSLQRQVTKKEVFKAVSSRVINSAYALEKVYGIPTVQACIKFFSGDAGTESTVERTNWRYGLTHILINESGYYQRFIPEFGENEVTRLLLEGRKHILAEDSIDLALETAVALRLTGVIDEAFEQALWLRVLKEFNGEFIPHERSNDINHREHRNVMAVIWLTLKEDKLTFFNTLPLS